MRDPQRISAIISLIERIWEKNPDLRLAQLIMNVCDYSCVDLYELSDTELVSRLKCLYSEDGISGVNEFDFNVENDSFDVTELNDKNYDGDV